MKKPIKALPPELFALQNVLDGMEELKRSPWFNDGKDDGHRDYYNIRNDAFIVIKDLCVEKEMEKIWDGLY